MQQTSTPRAVNYPTRVRNELVFREITVKQVTTVAGCFRRVVFQGDQLAGFTSAGFDDHIKMFFPDPATGELRLPTVTAEGIDWGDGPRPPNRDYTPLQFDAVHNELTIDFFIHAQGVASDWAATAKPGDRLAMGGPRGSLVVPESYAHQIYVCDESGLPALRRRLAMVAAHGGKPSLTVLAFVSQPEAKTYLDDAPDVQCEWLVAAEGATADTLMERVRALTLPAKDYFIWLTGEGEIVKGLSDHILAQGTDPALVRAVAYWHAK